MGAETVYSSAIRRAEPPPDWSSNARGMCFLVQWIYGDSKLILYA